MFEDLKDRYERNWCRKDQLVQFVQLGAINAEEFELITGDVYESE